MAYEQTQLPAFERAVTTTIRKADLQRSDWKRQTDAVKLMCVAAQMIAEDPERVFLIDVRIETSVIGEALRSGNPKGFFNQRCHDKGLKCRRIIILDTKSGRGMDEAGNQASNLHGHGVVMVPKGKGKQWLIERMRAVFGAANTLGARQFEVKQEDPEKHFTFAGRRGTGISGKMCYMMSHAGTTHSNLKLNDEGKRSRQAPKTQRVCNAKSKGLAAGIPSNFLSKIAIVDNESKRAAKQAFEAWMKADDADLEKEIAAASDHVTCHPHMEGISQPSVQVSDYVLPWSVGAGIVGPRTTEGPLVEQRASLNINRCGNSEDALPVRG